MRHRRIRRRYLTILVFLLLFAFIIFVEDQLQAMVPNLKHLAEVKLSEMMKGREEVEIGNIRGGLLRDLELDNVRIRYKSGAQYAPLFKIENIRLYFRIWDLLFRRETLERYSPLKLASPNIDIKIRSSNGWCACLIRLTGGLEKGEAKGALDIFGTRVNFKGEYLFCQERVILKNFRVADMAVQRCEIDLGTRTFELEARLDHAAICGVDLVAGVHFNGAFSNEAEDGAKSGGAFNLNGDLIVSNLIVNQRPFDDIRMSFAVRDRLLEISSLEMGGTFKASGKALLKPPAYPIDFTVMINNANMTQLLQKLRASDPTITSGILNAKITLGGAAIRPITRCNLDVKNGNMGSIYFKSMTATLIGTGPFIKIDSSHITRDDGYMTMTGHFDLRNIGRRNIFENVAISGDDSMVWGNLDIVRESPAASGEVKAKKTLSDDVNIGLKSYVDDGKMDPRDKENALELEYKMDQGGGLKMSLGQDKGFFGLEHKEKF